MLEVQRWYCALIFLFVLQVVASAVRYGIRFFIVKRFGYDDLAHLITLVGTMGRFAKAKLMMNRLFQSGFALH